MCLTSILWNNHEQCRSNSDAVKHNIHCLLTECSMYYNFNKKNKNGNDQAMESPFGLMVLNPGMIWNKTAYHPSNALFEQFQTEYNGYYNITLKCPKIYCKYYSSHRHP